MVDMGADAVICCHAHCPQPWEFYSGRPIIYGLGNLIFESIGEPEIWYMGYLARLNFEEENVQLDVVPYFQSKEKPGAHKMSREAGEKFLKEMELKNILVKDESFIKDQWDMCTRKRRYAYLESLFGHNNRIVRKIREFFAGKLHSKRDVLQALHFVQCETHREVLNTIFEQEKRKK
jgi:poly-gamma-glutamate synthesis protein (capsule biosynthesis protein)